MGVEGETVVGERVAEVGIPQNRTVLTGALFEMGIPGQILAHLGYLSLEVVVVDGGATCEGAESRAAAVM